MITARLRPSNYVSIDHRHRPHLSSHAIHTLRCICSFKASAFCISLRNLTHQIPNSSSIEKKKKKVKRTKLATDQRLLGQMTDCIIHLLVSFRLVLVGSECSILRIVRLRKKDSGECIVRLRKKGSGECMYMKSGRVRVRVGVGELGVGELGVEEWEWESGKRNMWTDLEIAGRLGRK